MFFFVDVAKVLQDTSSTLHLNENVLLVTSHVSPDRLWPKLTRYSWVRVGRLVGGIQNGLFRHISTVQAYQYDVSAADKTAAISVYDFYWNSATSFKHEEECLKVPQ